MNSAALTRDEIRANAPILKPQGDFFFKSVRADEKCFYHQFIAELIDTSTRYQKRMGPKGTFYVDGQGHKKRKSRMVDAECPEKTSQYTQDIKKQYTKFQSTSLGFEGCYSPVFGFSTRDTLIGFLFEKKDVLLSNNLIIYDGGTVNRSNEFYKEFEAKKYADNKVGTIIYPASRYEEYREKVQKTADRGGYSEPQVGLNWNCDGSSKVFIYTDTLEARLLAKQYADSLKNGLLKAGKCSVEYQIPICYYTPQKTDLLFREYTQAEYELDRQAARKIILGNSSPDPILSLSLNSQEIKQFETFYIDLLKNGHIFIFRFFMEKFDFALADVLDKVTLRKNQQSLPDILNRALQSNANEIAEFIYSKINLAAYQKNRLKTFSPIFAAIKNNDIAWAKRLIQDNWINLEVKNKSHSHNGTVLASAVYYNRLDIVKCLIQAGADVEAINSEGMTPLQIAAFHGHVDIVSYFCEYFQSEDFSHLDLKEGNNNTPFTSALNNGHMNVVSALIKAGEFDPFKKYDVNNQSVFENRFFHVLQHEKCFSDFVSIADPNYFYQAMLSKKRNQDTNFSFYERLLNKQYINLINQNSVRLELSKLMHSFLNTNECNHEYLATLLVAAVENESEYFVEQIFSKCNAYLLSNKNAVALKESLSEFKWLTNLIISAWTNSADWVFADNLKNSYALQVLASHHNIKFIGDTDQVYLCMAARLGCAATVERLIKKNIVMDVRDDMNMTPLDIALDNGHYEIANMFIKAGARIDFSRYSGVRKYLYLNSVFFALLKEEKLLNSFLEKLTDKDIFNMLKVTEKGETSVAVYLLSRGYIDLFLSLCERVKRKKYFLNNLSFFLVSENVTIAIFSHFVKYKNDELIDFIYEKCNSKYSLLKSYKLSEENQSLLLDLVKQDPHVKWAKSFILSTWFDIHSINVHEFVALASDVFNVQLDKMENKDQALLCMALKNGYENIAKYLLKNRTKLTIDINGVDNDGLTPLMLAADAKCEDLVYWLVDAGANTDCVKVYDENKQSCYQVMFKVLAQGPFGNKFIQDSDPEYITQMLLSSECVYDLLRNHPGFYLTLIDKCNQRDAVYACLVKMSINFLSECDASEERNQYLFRSIFLSLYKSKQEYLEAFLSSTPSCYIPDLLRELYLRHGDELRSKWIKDYILSGRVNLDAVSLEIIKVIFNAENWVALLSMAAESGYDNIVKRVLAENVHVNASVNNNRTPLHLAVQHNHVKVVDTLLSNHADIKAVTKKGKTSLDIAIENNRPEIANKLKRKLLTDYISKTKTRVDNNQTYSHWFNQGCYDYFGFSLFGYAASQKLQVSEKLLKVLDKKAAHEVLREHDDVLHDGELGDLYRTLYPD